MDPNKMQTEENISIIIADDHPLFRKGVKDMIEEQGWSVAGEAGDGERALALIKKNPSAILIVDIEMPKMNGLEVIKNMQKENLSNSVIVLTMHNKENIFNYSMDLGVMGFVIKDSVDTEIIDAVKNIYEGKYYISPSISGFLVKRGRDLATGTGKILGISNLTNTERKILKMISKNMTTKEIANELFISVHTVERHRANICQKLDLHGTNALLRFALDNQDMF
jgi:DNA-binding NarL/FixJ family response regulator